MFYILKQKTGFIQASLSKFKDFSRTSKDYPTVFKDKKFRKKSDLSVKILLQKCKTEIMET